MNQGPQESMHSFYKIMVAQRTCKIPESKGPTVDEQKNQQEFSSILFLEITNTKTPIISRDFFMTRDD